MISSILPSSSLVTSTSDTALLLLIRLPSNMFNKLFFGFFPSELLESMGLDFSKLPPWIMLWPPFFLDLLCAPFGSQCYSGWRSLLPQSLVRPGAWFSEEYRVTDIATDYPVRLTFEEFQSQHGFNVKLGSGILAGLEEGGTNFVSWAQSLYQFAFKTDSTCLANLASPASLATVFMLILFFKRIKTIILPQAQTLGQSLARRVHGACWLEQPENQARIGKFGEYIYRLIYHSFISLLPFYIFWDAPWLNQDLGGTRNLYVGFPHYPVSPSMTWYYLVQAAYNMDSMVDLLRISFQIHWTPKHSNWPLTIGWASTVRPDFTEMMCHHLATNILVYLSSFGSHTRIGSMVFWVHDLSDVPVDLCKLANFLKWTPATAICFFILCVVWVATRLYVLPFIIWKSIFTQSVLVIEDGMALGRTKYEVFYYFILPVFASLTGLLIVLHVYWFYLFIKMARLLIFTGKAHDFTENKTSTGGDIHQAVGHNVANGSNQSKKLV